MYVVVGLGNPGSGYRKNRHNVGFMVVDRLAARRGVRWRRSWRVNADVARVGRGEKEYWLCKPRTFMNRSGAAVARLLRRSGAGVEDLIIVVDDADLPLGRVRVRARGGAGGHNGLRSLIEALGTEEMVRVRVGIGRPPQGVDMVDYVLSDFGSDEWPQIEAGVERAADAVEWIMERGLESAMNQFNAQESSGKNEGSRKAE